MSERWQAFSDDEVAELFDALSVADLEVRILDGEPGRTLDAELAGELVRRGLEPNFSNRRYPAGWDGPTPPSSSEG